MTTIKGHIYALNGESGERLWDTQLGSPLLATSYKHTAEMGELLRNLRQQNASQPLLIPMLDGHAVMFTPKHGFQVLHPHNSLF